MSSISPIQLQWVLNSDVATAIKLFQSVLEAAATDSVQGQAIVACQEVGIKLAVSRNTTERVFRDMVPSPSPTKIKFLNATVGFSPKDSATKLATSEAGLRFLSLAAALIPTIGSYPSARVLEIELQRTKLELTDRPTLQHVDQLMQALKPRAELCNFANRVFGYHLMVKGLLEDAQKSTVENPGSPDLDRSKIRDRLLTGVPSPEAIAGLIDVFRRLARLGESTVTGTTITIGGSAPWILAFTEWCLGSGASIYLEGRQEPLFEQGNPSLALKVVLVNKETSDNVAVKAIVHHHQVDDIVELLGPIDSRPLRAMVDIEHYSQWLLTDLGFKRYGDSRYNDRVQAMLSEALRHSIPHILSNTCGEFGKLGQDKPSVRWIRSIHDPIEDLALSPLPAMPVIGAACSKFLGLQSRLTFPSYNECVPVPELPSVRGYLKSLEERCSCEQCSQAPSNPDLATTSCLQDAFFRTLAFLLLDILAFSLLDYPTSLRVFASPDRETKGQYSEGGIQDEISILLQFGDWEKKTDDEEWVDEEDDTQSDDQKKRTIDPEDIFEWAKSLVGHGDIDEEERTLIMTSKRGQVLYPLAFETLRIQKYGYFQLCVLPGTIRHDGLLYDVVSCPDDDHEVTQIHEHPTLPESLEVIQPMNLLSGFEMSWQIDPQPDKELYLYVTMRDKKRQSFVVKRDPMMALKGLSDVLLLEECPHGPRAQLSRPDKFCRYMAPWHNCVEDDISASSVDIFAIASNDSHRFFALSCSNLPAVLRRNACLSCCLQVCRATLVHSVIL